jgi:hypothetical protein
MKTLIGLIFTPFKLFSSTKFSSLVVQIFKKSPFLLFFLAFIITLTIMFLKYGI